MRLHHSIPDRQMRSRYEYLRNSCNSSRSPRMSNEKHSFSHFVKAIHQTAGDLPSQNSVRAAQVRNNSRLVISLGHLTKRYGPWDVELKSDGQCSPRESAWSGWWIT